MVEASGLLLRVGPPPLMKMMTPSGSLLTILQYQVAIRVMIVMMGHQEEEEEKEL